MTRVLCTSVEHVYMTYSIILYVCMYYCDYARGFMCMLLLLSDSGLQGRLHNVSFIFIACMYSALL